VDDAVLQHHLIALAIFRITASSIPRHAIANGITANDRSVPHSSSILHADGPFAPIKDGTTFSACFSRRKTTFSVLPTVGFRKGRGLAIGERRRMVQKAPTWPTIAFPTAH